MNTLTQEQIDKIHKLASNFDPEIYVDEEYDSSANGNFDDTFQDGIIEGNNQIYESLTKILKE
jgi:hypothetical protein